MQKLNLPEYDLKLRQADGRTEILDQCRKKFLVLTPEEWVRQNFLAFMAHELGYPLSLVKSEGGLTYNGRQKRTDILSYNNLGEPLLLVECKATSVKVDAKVFEQASVYNKKIKAKYLVVTNGLQHFCCEQDFESGKVQFLDTIPHYSTNAQ